VIEVPRRLAWWLDHPGGGEWLDRLPLLVEECASDWGLRLGGTFGSGMMSLTVAVEQSDGTAAVLKLYALDEDAAHEADALRFWDGNGAVRLLAHDRGRRALLLERCEPGTPLAEAEDDEVERVARALLPRLWRPPPADHPFRLLADAAARWTEQIPADWEALGRPFEARIVDEAVAACRELGAGDGADVLLHGDFHAGNVLCAEREPWLAIDPVPLVGDRAFDAASLLEHPRMRSEIDGLAAALGLDRERIRRWGIVSALVWGISGDKLERHQVERARMLTELR
jgi:streptomycin 6-kinase